ncbi:gp316 [Bacillus phage G]|uniref:Gp316 n=1 Tax=Bacillus phage G TaxID=2884420 RepID=G3MA57_9CAUD|nr:gp316 [Bacillus phage G]AEO93575.1 gp316 [Bacillus phage G]
MELSFKQENILEIRKKVSENYLDIVDFLEGSIVTNALSENRVINTRFFDLRQNYVFITHNETLDNEIVLHCDKSNKQINIELTLKNEKTVNKLFGGRKNVKEQDKSSMKQFCENYDFKFKNSSSHVFQHHNHTIVFIDCVEKPTIEQISNLYYEVCLEDDNNGK